MNLFKPKMYVKDVFSINYNFLKKKNIKMLVFDLDNTIVKSKNEMPNEDIKMLLNKLKKDFHIVIASNNYKKRVQKICDYLKCDYLSFIMKPTIKLKIKIRKKYSYEMNEICIIGDQILTDVFVGNRIRLYTILVDPLSDNDLKITAFNRLFEKKIKKKINLEKGKYYEEE